MIEGGQVGSGEGLVELYLGAVEDIDDDGKPRTVKRQVHHGAFITLDEGQALAEMGSRKGATILPTLRSMWTGGPVGQANASSETRRQLKGGHYCLGFVLGLQPSKAAALLADDNAGTPQRFIWASSTDPAIPADPVPWPDELQVTPPTASKATGHKLGFVLDDAVAREIRAAALARNRGEVVVDGLDAHADLLRLKVAALLAVLESGGRPARHTVNPGDWALAGVVVDTSRAVRASAAEAIRLDAELREQAGDRRAARRAAATEAAKEAAAEAKYARTLESAARSVHAVTVRDGEVNRQAANRAIGGRRRKIAPVDDVLAFMVEKGWLVEKGETYGPGPVTP